VRLQLPEQDYLFYAHAEDHQIEYEDPLELHDVETADVYIRAFPDLNPHSLTSIDPEKKQRVARSRRAIVDTWMQRWGRGELRWVGTVCPTAALAQEAHMSLEEYVEFVFSSGNLNAALQWVQERGLGIDDEPDGARDLEYIALAHILVTQHKLDEADRLLLRLIDDARAGDRVYMMVEMRLMRVMIFKARQQTTAAVAELKLALSLAETGGLTMIFVSKGKPVAELLENILAVKKRDHNDATAGFSLSYAKKLLSIFRATTPPKIEGLMDPISEREMEVLPLIAVGLSNREIADKLFISLNTVKTHTKSINSKLSVNSRTKAVARAKDLDLL